MRCFDRQRVFKQKTPESPTEVQTWVALVWPPHLAPLLGHDRVLVGAPAGGQLLLQLPQLALPRVHALCGVVALLRRRVPLPVLPCRRPAAAGVPTATRRGPPIDLSPAAALDVRGVLRRTAGIPRQCRVARCVAGRAAAAGARLCLGQVVLCTASEVKRGNTALELQLAQCELPVLITCCTCVWPAA